ncbi:hypothetical protein Aph01nite_34310 [Acrocarpospora phusangensis]|uniref:DUF2637 domain-containing protein n=1 Tax=Acrocarpospora phusangensis TaxID=1070424 RepID=A0A919QAA6_9ACTN|nr:DUF2637 domain-containing protein [Acrocarpospora phusangensis]GIH25121.1 hypothetical protein Aph01nite_34310 [Acrocarpospora phusangensis]
MNTNQPPHGPETTHPSPPVTNPATRRAAILVVSVIAAVAAYVSFRHQFGLARKAGDPVELAWTLPVLIDGMIAMASLVMLDSSKRGQSAPWLARITLAAGALATLAANVAHGWSGGPESRLISAVAPLVLVVAYELLMGMLRRGAAVAEPAAAVREDDQPAEPELDMPVLTPTVPRTAVEAARTAYEASVADGHPISERGLSDRFKLTRPQARQLIGEVVVGAVQADYSVTGDRPEPGQLVSRYGISRQRAAAILAPLANAGPAEPTDEELVAGLTPAEVLAGPGLTKLRERHPAAVNGTGA